jgi:UDP-2,4-diacetamido-2,4,6-trideoxy-beta-L-altropyranose hydrolase
LTYTVTKALLNCKEFIGINVVIGGAFLHKEIFDLEKENNKVKVFRNLSESELIKVMEESNFGIVPASTILYELCAVKMPVLSGYFVENQKNIYKGCAACGIIYEGGNFVNHTVKDFEKKIQDILAESNYQRCMEAQGELFDRGIKERFLGLFSGITYRKANADDVILLFDWANDKVSRANSYFTEPIPLETHKNWFEKKLKDNRSIIYIAQVENKPAGMVRYDILEDHTVVGTLVDESFRGRGLASCFLRDTARLYFKEYGLPVLAYIKEENIASVRSFEKANYKKWKQDVVQGCNSFVYKLENNDDI